jgi:hypothetical protein
VVDFPAMHIIKFLHWIPLTPMPILDRPLLIDNSNCSDICKNCVSRRLFNHFVCLKFLDLLK